MKLKAITAKEAKRINDKNGMGMPYGDGRTFYATDENETEVWEFDSNVERDEAISRG